MKKACILYFLLFPLFAFAQSGGKIAFQYDLSPTVSVDGQALLNPWAGGLNTTQYSNIRLNADTRDDLLVFDRSTNKISTFVAVDKPGGTGTTWLYAPEYETAFPVLTDWVLAVDYDFDGRKDLFTYQGGSVLVYHNESQNGQVAFKLAVNPLMTEGYSGRIQLFISSQDIPAITDYDDDGDIDIITFDVTGNLIAYQQNMSVERTGKKAGLDFKRYQNLCWGHFQKEFCNDFTFNVQCQDGSGRLGLNANERQTGAGNPAERRPGGGRPLHTGNTLAVVDADGDGHKDLLFGFVTCENIALLHNAGPNNEKANFIGYDSLFPAQKPILFPSFPAAFFVDLDGDGQPDLLASPNVSSNENKIFDFRASNWFYRNAGTSQKPDFQFIQSDFLQNDMLDLGERAAPALIDLDGDGDLDMLVGYDGTGVGKNYRASLWQFENRGTAKAPVFVLVTTDYLGTGSLALTGIVPSFADVDGNGSMDLILTGTGANGVGIRVFLNAAAKGKAVSYDLSKATLWPIPDSMGPLDLLTVADVDRDGKPDALISKYNYGTIQYCRNVGTGVAPVFQLQNQTFGGFTNDDYVYARARSIVVADVNGDQKNELIMAATNGSVKVYQFPDPADNNLTLLDSLPAIGLPGAGLIAAMADLDGDQLPDLMLGTRAGGLRYLKNTSQKIIITGVDEPITGPWAFPNPTNRYVTIRSPYDGTVSVLSISGQLVLPGQAVRANTETVIDLKSMASGTYFISLTAENRPARTQRIVVWK